MQQNLSNDLLDNIKICHVIITLSILGGAQRMLVRLLLANPESNRQQMVVVLRHAGAWGEQLRAAGVTVHELGMDAAWDVPQVFWRLRKLISAFHPDIVQTWMYHADFFGGIAAYSVGCKNIIWGIHRTALSLRDTKSTLVIMKLCAWMSRWLPKKIVSVAEAGKKEHIASGYDAKKMLVIPNGFDFSNLTATNEERIALRKTCNFLNDELVIGCLGRFHQVKGQDNFIEAAAIVNQNHPNVKFLMVGTDCDQHNSSLMEWIVRYHLENHVVLLGERSDVPVCLAAMDIFCMPSRTEGFPLCLGEAMSMGLPCVATNVGDVGVLAGDTAVLAPPRNAEAMAQGLLKVIKLSDEQRKAMGQKGKERVMAEFSIEKAYEQFDMIYRELVC